MQFVILLFNYRKLESNIRVYKFNLYFRLSVYFINDFGNVQFVILLFNYRKLESNIRVYKFNLYFRLSVYFINDYVKSLEICCLLFY